MQPSDHALLTGPPPDTGSIELGTVGWNDDPEDADHFVIEEGLDVLVKVTLVRGYVPGKDPKPPDGRAGGSPLLCSISLPMQHIPPDGARVVVAVPAGFGWKQPGAAMIIGQRATSPEMQFSGSKAKLDFGPDCDLVIKARSVTFSDYENRYCCVGPDYGFKVGAADAGGCYYKNGAWKFNVAVDGDSKGALEIAAGRVRLIAKGAKLASFIADGESGDVQAVGKRFVSYTDGGILGRSALPTNQVAFWAGGAPAGSPGWIIGIGA